MSNCLPSGHFDVPSQAVLELRNGFAPRVLRDARARHDRGSLRRSCAHTASTYGRRVEGIEDEERAIAVHRSAEVTHRRCRGKVPLRQCPSGVLRDALAG